MKSTRNLSARLISLAQLWYQLISRSLTSQTYWSTYINHPWCPSSGNAPSVFFGYILNLSIYSAWTKGSASTLMKSLWRCCDCLQLALWRLSTNQQTLVNYRLSVGDIWVPDRNQEHFIYKWTQQGLMF